jgi:hypothetical protein
LEGDWLLVCCVQALRCSEALASPDFALFCCGLLLFLWLCGEVSLWRCRYRGGALREPPIDGGMLDFDCGQCVHTQPTVKIRAFPATAWLALCLATKTVKNPV